MEDKFIWILVIFNALLAIGFAVFAGVWCETHHERFYIVDGDKVYICDEVCDCMFHDDGVRFVGVSDVYVVDGEYYYFRGNLSTKIPAEKIRMED